MLNNTLTYKKTKSEIIFEYLPVLKLFKVCGSKCINKNKPDTYVNKLVISFSWGFITRDIVIWLGEERKAKSEVI